MMMSISMYSPLITEDEGMLKKKLIWWLVGAWICSGVVCGASFLGKYTFHDNVIILTWIDCLCGWVAFTCLMNAMDVIHDIESITMETLHKILEYVISVVAFCNIGLSMTCLVIRFVAIKHFDEIQAAILAFNAIFVVIPFMGWFNEDLKKALFM